MEDQNIHFIFPPLNVSPFFLFFCLSFSFSVSFLLTSGLSCAHTHTHTHTHMRARARPHVPTLARTKTHANDKTLHAIFWFSTTWLLFDGPPPFHNFLPPSRLLPFPSSPPPHPPDFLSLLPSGFMLVLSSPNGLLEPKRVVSPHTFICCFFPHTHTHLPPSSPLQPETQKI